MSNSASVNPKQNRLKATFLTDVGTKEPKNYGTSKYVDIHTQIHDVLENFDEHLDNILERNEKDFLAAYRGHMTKVQKELEFYKEKTSDQEFKLRKDEHIQKIEKSLEWFREEALNLGKQMNQYKSEAVKWKARNKNLEYDNAFFEKQIISSKSVSFLHYYI